MRTALWLTLLMSVALLVPHQAVAVDPVTIDLIVGRGTLVDGTTFGLSALSYVVGTHLGNSGTLVVNGVSTECAIQHVESDCSAATLLCEDALHAVTPRTASGFLGSLDGVAVATGSIRMFCKHPLAARR